MTPRCEGMVRRGPQEGSGRPKDGPRWPQNDPKMAPKRPQDCSKWPKMAQDGPEKPRWPQHGPKMTQDGPEIAQTWSNIASPTCQFRFTVCTSRGGCSPGRSLGLGSPLVEDLCASTMATRFTSSLHCCASGDRSELMTQFTSTWFGLLMSSKFRASKIRAT